MGYPAAKAHRLQPPPPLLSPADTAVLRAAITALPARCRYHGDNTEPPATLIRREACCDTGVPAHRRKQAEAVLNRLTTKD